MNTLYHADGLHVCYGSTTSNATASLIIPIKLAPRINVYDIAISFDYLHSWNTSYIANSQCSLYSLKGNLPDIKEDKTLIQSVDVTSNVCLSKTVTYTGHCSHVINLPPHPLYNKPISNHHNIKEDFEYYLLECTNMEDKKLACLSTVQIV